MPSQNPQIALIIIYNHPYEKNIPIIEAIYRKRFSNIYHLMPFYQGNQANVIPVYAHSHLFQNYLPQALPYFFKEQYDHYFFIADDLLINPNLNENNFVEYLKLDKDTCFINKVVDPYHHLKWLGIHKVFTFRRRQAFLDITSELPSVQEPFLKELRYFVYRVILKCCQLIDESIPSHLMQQMLTWIRRKLKPLDYPVKIGFTDIFSINASTIKQVCHLCGVFAAAHLFVEIAFPTALALCTKKLVFLKDLDMLGIMFWHLEQQHTSVPLVELLNKQEKDLSLLLDNFPEKLLFIHAIKLSQFDTDKFL